MGVYEERDGEDEADEAFMWTRETGDGIRSGWSSAAMHGIVYATDDVLWYEPSLI